MTFVFSMKYFKYVLLLVILLSFTSCKNSRSIDKLVNPYSQGAQSNWSGIWQIYDDVLKTRGTIQYYTRTDNGNSQNIWGANFNCKEKPYAGRKCIKVYWTGEKVINFKTGALENWCGLDLVVANNLSTIEQTRLDLSKGGYTKISFWTRGELSGNTNFLVKGPLGDYKDTTEIKISPGDIDINTWRYYSFSVASLDLTNVKTFCSIILEYRGSSFSNGSGGTVYIDDLKLEQ